MNATVHLAARPARCLGRNAGRPTRGARGGGALLRPEAGAGLYPQRLRRRRLRPPRRQRRGGAGDRHRQGRAAAGQAGLDARGGHPPGQVPSACGGRLQGRASAPTECRPPGRCASSPRRSWRPSARPLPRPQGPEPMAVAGSPTTATTCRTRASRRCIKNTHLPVWFWRAPGANQHVFAIESFLDEIGDGGRARSLSDAAQAARRQARLAQGARHRGREGRLGQAAAARAAAAASPSARIPTASARRSPRSPSSRTAT